MTRILLAASAVCALAIGVANAGPSPAEPAPGLTTTAGIAAPTDLSAARKKAKRARMSRGRVSSGASKAGTGGGAGGEGGSGAATGGQSSAPRGNPAAPTR